MAGLVRGLLGLRNTLAELLDARRGRDDARNARGAYDYLASSGKASMEDLTNVLGTEETRGIFELPGIEGKLLLDVGCGTGSLGLYLKSLGARVIGVDIAEGQVRLAQEGGIVAAVQDVNNLAFGDELFDVVVCSATLHLTRVLGPCVAEMHRVLKTSGEMVVVMRHPWRTGSEYMSGEDMECLDADEPARIAVSYFRERRRRTFVSPVKSYYYYHRTLQAYMTAFLERQMVLAMFKELPIQRSSLPGYLAMRWRKERGGPELL